jgi:hypothetical protein
MVEHVVPLCLTISWLYSVSMLVQSIVYEKEQRLKEVKSYLLKFTQRGKVLFTQTYSER